MFRKQATTKQRSPERRETRYNLNFELTACEYNIPFDVMYKEPDLKRSEFIIVISSDISCFIGGA